MGFLYFIAQMTSCPRVSFRRRCHYATRSNRIRMVRTPGNKLTVQRNRKRSQGIHTPWVLGHKRIGGTKALNHTDSRTSNSNGKTVSRAYGGVLSHEQVKDRILRAFLVEEQRLVKRVATAERKYRKDKQRAALKNKKKTDKKSAIAKRVTGKSAPAKKAAPAKPAAAKKVAKK
eukprot:GILI01000275.1.p1 GENE.GILI01000275.1~~GILI01000275.1.p1  ORF type:complete len:174 (+),score=65.77 GILI01000275.1:1-522(+)